jgi:hypothetical protein
MVKIASPHTKFEPKIFRFSTIYLFFKCQNFRKLRSFLADFKKKVYCLLKLKFYRISELLNYFSFVIKQPHTKLYPTSFMDLTVQPCRELRYFVA